MEKISVSLIVPEKYNDISELIKWLNLGESDIYIFPEGFLSSDRLNEAAEVIKKKNKFVILGLDDKRNNLLYETALVIDQTGIIGEYRKTALTSEDVKKGHKPGEEIHCIQTKFGCIGIPICYEIHFPEIARTMALQGAELLINLVGVGMVDEHQLDEWLCLARARAIENEIFVLGCSHYKGNIPVAFAISPLGDVYGFSRNNYDVLTVNLDLSESKRKKYNYLHDRNPALYSLLSKV